MENWLIGLVLKPILGIVMLVAFYGAARLLAIAIWYVLPDGKLKTLLFERYRSDGTRVTTRPGQRDL